MKLDWKQIIVALILGIVLGALGTLRCMPFGSHGFLKNPEKMHRHMMEQFTSKLRLTPDQQQKISAILDDTRTKISLLRGEVHPKFEEIRNISKTQIRELLTSDQQKKFDVMSAEMDVRFRKHRDAMRS